jgi:hypothetical protein
VLTGCGRDDGCRDFFGFAAQPTKGSRASNLSGFAAAVVRAQANYDLGNPRLGPHRRIQHPGRDARAGKSGDEIVKRSSLNRSIIDIVQGG